MAKAKPRITVNKITLFIVGSGFVFAIILIRLFQLQIISHDYYQDLATQGQYGFIELPAKRGDIIIKDYHSEEEFPLATNTTLNLLYADPSLIEDPLYLTEKLAPLLFELEEERAIDDERIQKLAKKLPKDLTEEQIDEMLKPLTDEELKEKYTQDLLKKLSEKRRAEILLTAELDIKKLEEIRRLNVSGIAVDENKVYAYPSQISDPASTAEAIADYVEIPSKKLSKILKGENRYIILKRKLHPEISEKIKGMFAKDEDEKFVGLGMQEEYYRFYPEGPLAANVVGYTDRTNFGQYGIESSLNNNLQGVAGKLQTKRDSIGRQITVGESILEPAKDGDDIVLTIDRSIQLKVEQILESAVKEYRADSGQVVIMNPKTGAIIAMAHYPTFDPNSYGDVFRKVQLNLTPEEIANLTPTKTENVYYFYRDEQQHDRYLVFEEKDEENITSYYRYENYVGPEAYHNKIVAWPYEPGSVFKTIAMAAAIDDGDITPNTTFNDSGPVGVDWNQYKNDYDFYIKNVIGYLGLTDMKNVLAQSLNTGMTFIAKKIGPALFYSYLEKFGFLDRTDIEFDSEAIGKVEYWEDWTESELATHAFGQGMTVTAIQMVNAYCAIANGGILMQPYIVQEIRHDDGTVTTTEPHEIRRVISEDTSTQMRAMLLNAIENGVAKNAKVEGHYVAGKTGTSQTYKYGRALTGPGTTIATFAGFAPVDDPQFVVLVKFDKPRSTIWGDSTASPTFNKIGSYLFDYYNIPPDKTIPKK